MALTSGTGVGYKVEASWGAGATIGTVLPVTDDPTFTPTFDIIRDQARRDGIAAVDFKNLQGAAVSDISLAGLAYPEEVGDLINAITGGYAVSGSGPYTHVFTLGAAPKSYCFEFVNPTQARKFTGCVESDLGFTFSAGEGALAWTSSWQAKEPTAIGATSITDATAAPFLGWEGSLTIGGGADTTLVSGEITMARALNVLHTAQASQDPARIDADRLEVTASLVFDYAEAAYLRFLNHTENAVVLTFTKGTKSLKFQMTNFAWGDEAATYDLGDATIRINMTGRAQYNTTDAGPVKITLINNEATYVS